MSKASARRSNGRTRETTRPVSVRIVESTETRPAARGQQAMNFGDHLRAARTARGITVRDISVRTRIALRSLEALEQNEVGKLPGGIFSRAFVRAYAQEVGLDPDETVRLFVQQFPIDHVTAGSTDAVEGEIGRGQEAQRRRQRLGLLLTAAIGIPLVGLAAYLIWSARRPANAADMTPTAAPTPVAAAAPAVPVPVAASTVTSTSPAPAPAPIRGDGNVTPPAALPQPDSLQIAMSSADGPCWIRVKGDGALRYQGTLNAGEKQTGDAHDSLELLIGDAGQFRYSINGRPGRVLGTSGQVVVARITRANWQDWLQR
jgi:cytoskeleton protein RodZ